MRIISRLDAVTAGIKQYFTGEPCKHGHISARQVLNGRCIMCANDRLRVARAARPEHYRAISKKCAAKSRNADLEAHRLKRAKWSGLPAPTRPRPVNCECCGRTGKNSPGDILQLDHDHTSGSFRGWLCGPCNTAIGKLGDCASGVRRAMDYLVRSGDKS